MNAQLPEETLVAVVGLCGFVAGLCLGQQETMNVALCRFTHSYYPAKDLGAEANKLADGLARAHGLVRVAPEPAS